MNGANSPRQPSALSRAVGRVLAARLVVAALCAVGAVVAGANSCVEARRPSPPGYAGEYPSPSAQSALHELRGKTLANSRLVAPSEILVFDSFAVVPNPVTRKGPVVSFTLHGSVSGPVRYGAAQGEGGRYWLPVLTDGDAADLVERLSGAKPTGFAGETSAIYRATLGL